MGNETQNVSATDSSIEDVNETGQDTQHNPELDKSNQEDSERIQKTTSEGYQARNFAELREQAKKAERERDEALRRLQQVESDRVQQKQKEQESEPNPFDFGGNDDDLAEIKHLKAIAKRQQELEKRLQQYQQQSTQMTAEARLKSQYQDLEKVVNDENIRRLQEEDPDLAMSLQHNPDPYTKYAAAYKAIKRMGIYQEDNYEADRKRAQVNANKPRPLASVAPQQGNSPLTRANAFANGLTSELKSKLIKEMQDARKKY